MARVAGLRVGHWTDLVGRTGCTVVLCPPGTVGSGEVRGGAPGTRETDLLKPGRLVQEVNAVLLTGGSAFGLGSADGVMRYLEERGIGFDAGVARVPIVPAAVLFDLGVGDPGARPGPDQGYAACLDADRSGPNGPNGPNGPDGSEALGAVGAGAGATVAKLHGPDRAVPGGIGSATEERDGLVVTALAAVNASGEIVDDEGEVLAGARPEGPEATNGPAGGTDEPGQTLPGMNTTLVVVATNARLSRERAHLLALAGHEGLLRAIRPAHTMFDGDTVFSLATGEIDAPQVTVEELAERAVAGAIRHAVPPAPRSTEEEPG
jgi:L-aminopeptidase/D-esterase-like protein